MENMLMLYVNERGRSKLAEARKEQGAAAYITCPESLKNAGALRGGQRLKGSSAATTVRVADGGRGHAGHGR